MNEDGVKKDDGPGSMPIVRHEVSEAEVTQFAANLFLDRIAPGRISGFLMSQLYCCATIPAAAAIFGDVPKIEAELRALEGIFRRSTGTKPAEQFERLPLKGLWKKHYLMGGLRSYAWNLKAGAGKGGQQFKKIIKSRHQPDVPPQEVAKNIANDIGRIYAGGARAQELTGEWIVFAKHEGQNYYLCLAMHKQGDDDIFRVIRDGCVGEFPFLASLLNLEN